MKNLGDKINFDVRGFFENSLILLQDYQSRLVSYYTNDGDFPKDAFDLLDRLESEVKQIYSKVKVSRSALDKFSDFVVFDQIEDFASTFRVIENYSRWLRSSTIKGRYKRETEIDFILRQNQTLEELSDEIGWDSREKGFLDLTTRNQIKETDYDLSGGLVFKFSYQNEKNFQLVTVVDEMTGENILGKDVARQLRFEEDDLLALSPADTFFQTCEILTGLFKNSNPEFSDDGFDKSAISNRNIMRIRLSTFIRQMYATVSKDDTIASFAISDVREESDCLKIEMQYRSYLSTDPVKTFVYGN